MKHKKYRTFVGDFETTVFKGQTFTEVWASAVVELYTEDVYVFHSISETFDYYFSLNANLIIYYHNLKFDGSFIVSYLLKDLGLKQAFSHNSEEELDYTPMKQTDMPANSFKYVISAQGQWYSIIIKYGKCIIEIRDSLKLLPFKLAEIGKAFQTKHQKLEMEYEGKRYAGCPIKPEEKEYIKNDVLVIKEALEIMFKEGHDKLTIGSCCLSEYKKQYLGEKDWRLFFPNLLEIPLNPDEFGSPNAEAYIRKSYKGGYCYLVPEKANKMIGKCDKKVRGVTADVNSLYPSVMHSASGNYYPVGKPHFWKGNTIPKEALVNHRYYFVRIKTRFYIKHNKLPCIQIKKNLFYRGTEWLKTSDIYDYKRNKYSKTYIDKDGQKKWAYVTLTLTMTDYKLIREHYNLIGCEILDGCWFESERGLFDRYINKYRKIKETSKGAIRTLAKLFLNNLYGKFATSAVSSFKYAKLENGVVRYYQIYAEDKEPVFIPVGSAITSYARNFTIRAAQANYFGADKPGFIYADTDSIHCDVLPEELNNIEVHPTEFLKWKLEASWDRAVFVRQKTYIEHVVAENCEEIDKPFYNIKCAGMPDKCKELFELSVKGCDIDWKINNYKKYNKMETDEKYFVSQKRELSDFKVGLCVPGKLTPKTIMGGVLLTRTTYEMRPI